jgi:hypothetical protein
MTIGNTYCDLCTQKPASVNRCYNLALWKFIVPATRFFCYSMKVNTFRAMMAMLSSIRLTPWSRALLEKVTNAQLLKKFLAFFETRNFITVFTRAHHWYLSWARWIQSTPSQSISLKPILILSYQLRLVLPNGLFRFSDQNTVSISHFRQACYDTHPFHPLWFGHPDNSILRHISTYKYRKWECVSP